MEPQKKQLYRLITPSAMHWVGNGFHVATMISPSQVDYSYTSPFVLLDYARPKMFEATDVRKGVGEHPHRGFETVTFAIQGEVEHRDSSGGGGIIGTGDVQWMTAGSGVVHEEFHSQSFSERGGIFEMVQLWVNLPAKDKMNPPRYQSLEKESFPVIEKQNYSIKLIAGKIGRDAGPALTHTPILMFEVFVKEAGNVRLDIPSGHNLMVLQLKKESQLEGQRFEEGSLSIFEREGNVLELEGVAGGHLLVLSGQAIDEPLVAYGPFVMNSKQEIVEAFQDYHEGKMGTLVRDDQ